MTTPLMPANQLQHGVYQIERLGPLLRVSIAEGLNRELILQYQHDMASSIEELNNQWWGLHLVIHGDVVMTPEASVALIEVTRSHRAMGRCGTAIQLVNSNAVGLMKAIWSHIYQESLIPYTFCDSAAEAELWLHEQIALAQANRQNIESL
jgi:hypothetical protein